MALLRLNALIVLLFYSVYSNVSDDISNQNRRRHPQENVSYLRSTRNADTIKVVPNNSQLIQAELHQANRQLHTIGLQNEKTQTALEDFKMELQRFSQQQQQQNLQTSYIPSHRENTKLDNRIDTLTKAVKIMIATMRGLNADILEIRNNVNSLTNKTEDICRSNKELLTKQIFNTGLLDLKTNQPTYTTCPSDGGSASSLPKSCKDVKLLQNQSAIYKIQPDHSIKPLMVFCDMTINNGGWTVIHNRENGLQDFYQNWQDYKHGFGNLGGEFWLGLDNIHLLTGHEVNELLIELEDFDSKKVYAHYGAFSVGSELEGFPIKVLGGYNGDAGDSLIYHAGNRFSSKDMDQDSWPEGSCAQSHGGGWWYRSCDTSNLNGRYLSGELPEQYIYQGMYWGEFRGAQYSLLKARMLVRPRDLDSPPMFADNTRNTTLQ